MEKLIPVAFDLILAVISVVLIPKIHELLVLKIGKDEAARITTLIYEAVRAAEQLYREPGNGKVKKEYVVNLLVAQGIEMTEELNARVEAAVYDLDSRNATAN